MIDFEVDPITAQTCMMIEQLATNMMRPVSHEMDEHEHRDPQQYIDFMWNVMKQQASSEAGTVFSGGGGRKKESGGDGEKKKRPSTAQVLGNHIIEMLSWGDAGIYLSTPAPGLGGAAIAAAGTPEQKEKFLKRFQESDKPVWAAMARRTGWSWPLAIIELSHAGNRTNDRPHR
jgi:acyl-CoA dehydrogenase